MDGTEVSIIYNSTVGIETIGGIAIDFPGSRLYWNEVFSRKILSSDLQGGDVRTNLELCPKFTNYVPFGIGLYRGRIYWGKYDGQIQSRSIRFMDDAEGTEMVSKYVEPDDISYPAGCKNCMHENDDAKPNYCMNFRKDIAVYLAFIPPELPAASRPNECENQICSGLCVLSHNSSHCFPA